MKNKPIYLVRLFALLHAVIGCILTCIALPPIENIDISTAITYVIFNYALYAIAQILFLIYIFAFYDKKPKHILLPISYIVYVCDLGLTFISGSIPEVQTYLTTNNIAALFKFIFADFLIESLVPIAFFVFLAIVCFTKFNLITTARKIVIIYSAISIVTLLLSIPTACELINSYKQSVSDYPAPITAIYKSNICLYFASITFIFNTIANFFLWRFALPNKIKDNT